MVLRFNDSSFLFSDCNCPAKGGFLLKATKCPNCGASIKVNLQKEQALCDYCGSSFVLEKTDEDDSSQGQEEFSKADKTVAKKIGCFILIIVLVIFLFTGGIIYFVFDFAGKTIDSSLDSNSKNVIRQIKDKQKQ
jgi:ribosomal protein S27AE